jgi:molybdopterin-guanine dinucleotide biosynthesis protein MobB
VSQFSAWNFSVSTLKHASQTYDSDKEFTDSWRHRKAGAQEVIVASDRRWTLHHENKEDTPASLEMLLEHLSPSDIILFEGWKDSHQPKLEVYRGDSQTASIHDSSVKPMLLVESKPNIRAIATDTPLTVPVPTFDLNDSEGIARFILNELGLLEEFSEKIAIQNAASSKQE